MVVNSAVATSSSAVAVFFGCGHVPLIQVPPFKNHKKKVSFTFILSPPNLFNIWSGMVGKMLQLSSFPIKKEVGKILQKFGAATAVKGGQNFSKWWWINSWNLTCLPKIIIFSKKNPCQSLQNMKFEITFLRLRFSKAKRLRLGNIFFQVNWLFRFLDCVFFLWSLVKYREKSSIKTYRVYQKSVKTTANPFTTRKQSLFQVLLSCEVGGS